MQLLPLLLPDTAIDCLLTLHSLLLTDPQPLGPASINNNTDECIAKPRQLLCSRRHSAGKIDSLSEVEKLCFLEATS